MARILISGLINIETTVKVDGFPIHYAPVRYPFFGVNTTVSGVGYNVAKALTTLGDQVAFCSLIGHDLFAPVIRQTLAAQTIPTEHVLESLDKTAQSVILYDGDGRRQINVDLKNIQEQHYPQDRFAEAITGCSIAVLCNINFSRPFLASARSAGALIATDVHAIGNLDDDYNRDFMAAADILFMSHEHLPAAPEDWAQMIFTRYSPQVIVIGLGQDGALLAVRGAQDMRGFVGRFPAVKTCPVVNTIGAGDALFSAFVHYYARKRNPYEALQKALVFASYKIGTTGAADGFLDEPALERLYAEVSNR